jgi:hypothetical protein
MSTVVSAAIVSVASELISVRLIATQPGPTLILLLIEDGRIDGLLQLVSVLPASFVLVFMALPLLAPPLSALLLLALLLFALLLLALLLFALLLFEVLFDGLLSGALLSSYWSLFVLPVLRVETVSHVVPLSQLHFSSTIRFVQETRDIMNNTVTKRFIIFSSLVLK